MLWIIYESPIFLVALIFWHCSWMHVVDVPASGVYFAVYESLLAAAGSWQNKS